MSIVSRRIHGWQMILAFIELPAAALLFGLLLLIWSPQLAVVHGVSIYPVYFVLVLSAILIDNLYQSQADGPLTAAIMHGEIGVIVRRTAGVALVWFGFLAARQDHSVSRIFLFAYLALLPFALVAARKFARMFLGPKVFGVKEQFGVMLLGSPDGSEELVRWLASNRDIGVNLLGYLSPAPVDGASGLPWHGTEQELSAAVERTQAKVVVSLALPGSGSHGQWLRETCDRLGVRLAFQWQLGGGTPSSLSLCQGDGFTLLSTRNEPLQSPFNRMVKRLFDLCVAVPVVIFVLPPLAVFVWLLQRIYSPGPLLYRQQRGGLSGQPFTMLKFRTMDCDGHDETQQAVRGDGRVFRGGHWLRRHSIDEFPQFLNVLEGSMSIVGPRPHLTVHDTAFSMVSGEYRIRSLIKPGITGLAQVKGHRGPTPESHHITSRVKADLQYLENWTLTTDAVLVLRTVFNVVTPVNAV